MKPLIILLSLFYISSSLFAQDMQKVKDLKTVTTNHTVSIKGQKVAYSATTGMMPVLDNKEREVAELFYTFYERTDVKKSSGEEKAMRPLVISFNGGPGSASVWMHLAYTGPRVLNIDDEGYPVMPYGVRENPYSILDVADIVYVNPVNTGYSRVTNAGITDEKEKVKESEFFGVNEDIEYLASWINLFVTRYNRWPNPKYLIGESYGTTRVSGLALELQQSHWMFLNGVILVSPTGLGIDREGPWGEALALPYFTAAAWYHKRLPAALQNKDLDEVLAESEKFTLEELIPAVTQGGFMDDGLRDRMAERVAYFSGVDKEVVLDHNLLMPTGFFWKELLREEGYTIGRLDSRYLGIDRKDAGDRPDFNAELTSWEHSFTPAINYYMWNELKYRTDRKYNVFGSVYPWNRNGDNTGENLRQAMAMNPYLHVMTQSGYYDGATQYFDAKYNMWQLDPSGRMKDRLSFRGYRSGHMMYLRREDLQSANEHIRLFIQNSLPEVGAPAGYFRK